MFLFFRNIHEKRFKNLMKHFKLVGVTPRTHENSRKRPHNALSFESVNYITTLITNYSEQHGLVLPGRVPGYSRTDILLLPSSTSKHSVWLDYQQAASRSTVSTDIRAVGYTTFCNIWHTLLPHLVKMKPMSDLCWTCQQNSTKVMKMMNRPEGEKSAALKSVTEHIELVQKERGVYKFRLQISSDGAFCHEQVLFATSSTSTTMFCSHQSSL